MNPEYQFISRVRKIGASYYVLIPKHVVKAVKIEEGDYLIITVKKIHLGEEKKAVT
ncbi:MAG: AbrB/MazE/SpoVT family DNA-binding domain-containing protein [Candidatus Njordarchaeales archaeon]